MKRILVVYYSQSGQLEQILERFLAGFEHSLNYIEKIKITPVNPYPFPWTSDSFFATMPHSVLGISTPIDDFQPKYTHYDLVILGYQPWYLSPSIPTTSILKNQVFQNIIANTPLITVIGARNMWLNAQEKLKLLLAQAQAKLVGNIVLIDRNNNYASAVSILQWMLTGKKERYKGIFPWPGVSVNDIHNAHRYGRIVADSLESNSFVKLQDKLVEQGAVEVNSTLMFIEQRAGKLFTIWAKAIESKINKKLWLKIFKYYLFVALFLVAPVVLLLYNIFIKPFAHHKIQKVKKYYLGLN